MEDESCPADGGGIGSSGKCKKDFIACGGAASSSYD
jgi:hypothetical protein